MTLPKLDKIERTLRVAIWNSSKATLPRLGVFPSELLIEAIDLRNNGLYEQCVNLLTSPKPVGSPYSYSVRDYLNDSPTALNELAMALLGLRQYDDALKQLDKADVSIKQLQAMVAANRALILTIDGRYEEAWAAAQQAIAASPNEPAGYLNGLVTLAHRQAPNDDELASKTVREFRAAFVEQLKAKDSHLRSVIAKDMHLARYRKDLLAPFPALH